MNTKLVELQKENQSHKLKIDHLKIALKKAKEASSVKQTALDKSTHDLNVDLKSWREKALKLESDNLLLNNKFMQAEGRHKDELMKNDNIIRALGDKSKDLERINKELGQKILDLEVTLGGAEKKHNIALEKKDEVLKVLADEVKREIENVIRLKLDIGRLNNELDNARINHENMIKSLTTGDEKTRNLTHSFELISRALEEEKTNVERLNVELTTKARDLKRESEKAKNFEQEITALNVNFEEAKRNFEIALLELAKNIETSKDELVKLGEKNDMLAQENSRLKSGLEETNKSLVEVEEKLALSSVTKDVRLSSSKLMLEEKDREINTLNLKIKSLNDTISEHNNVLKELKEKEKSILNLKRKLEELEKQSEKVQMRYQEISSLNAKLEKDESEYKTEKNIEIAKLENQLKTKERDLNMRTEELKQKSEIIQTLPELNDKISSLTHELKAAQTEIEDLKKSPPPDSDLKQKKDLEDGKKALIDEKIKSQELEKVLIETKEEIKFQKKEIDILYKEFQNAQNKVKLAQKSIEGNEKTIKTLEDKIRSLQDELSKEREIIAKTRAQLLRSRNPVK